MPVNDEHDCTEPTEGASRRSIPVPEPVIAELRRLRAAADARFARHGGATADAPLVLVYDEAHGAFELPVDPAARAAFAEAARIGSRARMRPVAANVPDTAPVLDQVRAADDAMRMRVEREHAEAEHRRREQQRAERRREITETVAAAETAWHNLFRPDAQAPELAWKSYPSTLDQPGGKGPLAVAHLGEGVFVHAEPSVRGGALSVLAPCACGPNRYRRDPVRSAAQLSRVLDQILGETPECAETCAPPDGAW
jgi:hypothetical protein